MVGCWACAVLELDWIWLGGVAVEHGFWGTGPDASYWQDPSASQVTWASPQFLQQLQDPSEPRVPNVRHCWQVVGHLQLFRPFLHLTHEDLVILTHTLALEIVLDSISVMVGDGDDVHAARYRAISTGRHAPNLNWTRRMTEVKQQDYKENLFYYTWHIKWLDYKMENLSRNSQKPPGTGFSKLLMRLDVLACKSVSC